MRVFLQGREMAENRIYLRLSEGKREELVDWADQQGRPITNLASWLVERAIEQAKESGEYKPRSQPQPDRDPEIASQRDRAIAFIQAILNRESVDGIDLAKLANDLNVSTGELFEAIKQCGGKIKNGK